MTGEISLTDKDSVTINKLKNLKSLVVLPFPYVFVWSIHCKNDKYRIKMLLIFILGSFDMNQSNYKIIEKNLVILSIT